jgi:hypothetical protein
MAFAPSLVAGVVDVSPNAFVAFNDVISMGSVARVLRAISDTLFHRLSGVMYFDHC